MKISKRLFPLLLLFHLFLILKGGYFLSPEFTLYPYFSKIGLLPYQKIIDQHLPFLLFGPIALPSFLTANPMPLLVVFLLTLAITDTLFYLSLIRFEAKRPLLITALFIFVSYYFQGNFLWYETFTSLFLSAILFLVKSKTEIVRLILGVFLSLLLLIKPTLVLPLIFLVAYLKIKPSRYLFIGILLPIIIVILYLSKYDLFKDFYHLVYQFNKDYYLRYGYQYPTTRQVLEVVLISIFPVWILIRKNQLLSVILCLSWIVLAFPRFEYLHLQPYFLILLFVMALAEWPRKINKYVLPAVCVVFLIVTAKALHKNYGNFYLTQDSIKTAEYLRKSSDNTIYILGGDDLIYELADKTPPGQIYIPSLPWYTGQETFQYSEVQALNQSPQTRILVNSRGIIEGRGVVKSDSYLWKFITKNYQKLGSVASYDVYESNLFFEEKDKI